jgi:hypothetical protein
MASNPSAQQEPSSLGCWLVSQPGTMWPVRQDLKVDTIPLQARTAIASACVAPIGCGSAALYESESFMSPIETSQPVVATGSLINTYTGEVSDLFEDAMPPPDNGRDAGDAVRERKQAQRRLMAALGNVNASHHKREQQDPIQPGDAGVVTQLANFQINADVATEFNERANRDLFFNRNELAPTELEMTRNPFGFEGYNNRVRINPYLLPTQDLEDKDWVPNATLLPGGDHRPKHKTKLRRDRARTDYAGQATGQQAGDGRADVRRSQAARDEEGCTEVGRCVTAQALYGNAVASGAQRLTPERSQCAWTSASASPEGQAVVSAASVLASLGCRGGAQAEAPTLATAAEVAPAAGGAAQTAGRRELGEALDVGQRRAVAGQETAGVHVAAQHGSRKLEARASQRRDVLGQEAASVHSGAQRSPRCEDAPQSQRSTVDAPGAGAFAGGQHRRTEERRAPPRAELGATPALAAGALGVQRQSLGGSDARTVDPASLVSTLTSFEGPALVAAQTLAADMRRQPEAPRNSQGHVADLAAVAAVALRGDAALYGDTAPLDAVGLTAMAPHGAQAQSASKKLALDGADRAAGLHLDSGCAERSAAVTARNARGEGFAARRDGLKVGGDVDFQKRPTAALREWKAELLTRPGVVRSAGSDGQRCTQLPAREARQARSAKSPFRAHALRERTGIDARLAERRESRYETDED